MQKLIVFNSISMDGYFADKAGGMGWAHNGDNDPEWDAFVSDNAKGGGTLVFGRVTYDLMASFWPTPQASQMNPVVAERMNACNKIVFSKTLTKPAWQNTKVLKGDLPELVRELKNGPGEGMAIMGSGKVVSQLALHGLIDEYQMVIVPIVLGAGRTMFDGIAKPIHFKRTKERNFANGNVVIWYQPTKCKLG